MWRDANETENTNEVVEGRGRGKGGGGREECNLFRYGGCIV